jgi:hypothetical protein
MRLPGPRTLTIPALASSLLLMVGFRGAAYAAPVQLDGLSTWASASGVTTVTHDSETVHLAAADCATVQARAHSTDPSLCAFTVRQTVTTTVYPPVKHLALRAGRSGASVGANPYDVYYCPRGTQDVKEQYPFVYGVGIADDELDTYFSWNGDCSYPSNYQTPQCYPVFTVAASWGDKRCYSYTYSGTMLSRADVYSQYTYWTAPPWSFWVSQRIECYNDQVGDCNWSHWVGL